MSDLILKHYGKLIAFLAGWASEAMLEASAFIKALLP